jgi:hypothetical protein
MNVLWYDKKDMNVFVLYMSVFWFCCLRLIYEIHIEIRIRIHIQFRKSIFFILEKQ